MLPDHELTALPTRKDVGISKDCGRFGAAVGPRDDAGGLTMIASEVVGLLGLAYTLVVVVTRGRRRGWVPSSIRRASSSASAAWWALAAAILSVSFLVMPYIFSRLLATVLVDHPVFLTLSDLVWLGILVATLACVQVSLAIARPKKVGSGDPQALSAEIRR